MSAKDAGQEQPASQEQPSEGVRSPAPANTYVIDSEHAAELARLMLQDRVVTEGMGGLFPEGQTLPEGGRVLDLACGPGGWAMEVAYSYPKVEVIGVDLSRSVVEYANAQAQSRGLENAHFRVMNVMEPLDFADASFDLVNGRFMCLFMLPAAWPRLLAECRRILKPGGVVRLTEAEWPLTTSAAFQRYGELGSQALKLAGQSFSPDGHQLGITPLLARLLREAGFQEVRLRSSVIEWSSGTPSHYAFFKDYLIGLELGLVFLARAGLATQEELTRLVQQAVAEMQLPEFCAVTTFLTAWGRNP